MDDLFSKCSDFDQEILQYEDILGHIHTIISSFECGDLPAENVAPVLRGILTLYQIKFEKIYETYNDIQSNVFKLLKQGCNELQVQSELNLKEEAFGPLKAEAFEELKRGSKLIW